MTNERVTASSWIPTTLREHRQWWEENTNVPYGYCWCGCGEETRIAIKNEKKRRNVKGTPFAYIQSHAARIRVMSFEERYKINPETGCWDWIKGKANGYGAIQNPRTQQNERAHRVIYEHHRGPIPKNYHLHHTCHNEGCVNPEHLEPLNPDDHHALRRSTKLSYEKAKQIRHMATQGYSTANIGKIFGVTDGAIRAVLRGDNWKKEKYEHLSS